MRFSTNRTRFIVLAGLFTALAVVLKVFLGIPVTAFGGFAKDINLSPVVVMYSGVLLGPMGGGIVGALTDFLAWLVRPMGGYVPLFTLTNALIGVIPGLFFIKSTRAPGFLRLALATFATQTICSFALNTLFLIWLGYMPPAVAWMRGVSAFICWPIYTVLIYLLLQGTQRLRNNHTPADAPLHANIISQPVVQKNCQSAQKR